MPVNAQTIALATSPFDEALLPTANISGEIVAGVLEHRQPSARLSVQAYIPGPWAGQTVCLRAVSVDGFYTSENAYEVPTLWEGGFAVLPYPTEHEDYLLGLERHGFGMRVTRGSCASPPTEFTVTVWNAEEPTAIQLLVNPLEAEAVFAYFGDTITPVRCTDIDLPGKSAFHVACDLAIVAENGAVNMQILRIDGSQAFPSEPLILWMPER